MPFSAEPEYGGRAYLEKQDYILFKQKEQLAAQEQKLEELTMKIEDVEALVEQSKAWVLSPERKASKKEISGVCHRCRFFRTVK